MPKAKPKHLGKGEAAAAAKKLKKRKSRIDAAVVKASGGKKRVRH